MIHISKFAYFSIVVTLFSFSGCKESGSEVSDSTPDVQVEFVDTTPGLRDTIDSRMSELEYTDAEKAEVNGIIWSWKPTEKEIESYGAVFQAESKDGDSGAEELFMNSLTRYLGKARFECEQEGITLAQLVEKERMVLECLSAKIYSDFKGNIGGLSDREFCKMNKSPGLVRLEGDYILFKSVGLNAKVAKGNGFIGVVVSLSDGKVIIVNQNTGESSEPFVMEDLYVHYAGRHECKLKKKPQELPSDFEYWEAENLRASMHFNLALCYRSTSEHNAEALEYYDKAIELDGGRKLFHYRKGKLLIDEKKYNKALSAFEKALKIDKDDYNSLCSAGFCHIQMEENEKALPYYEKAIVLDPGKSLAYYNRAFILSIQEKYDQAILDYEVAIKLSPKWGDAYVHLSRLHRDKNDEASALKVLDRGMVHAPNEVYDEALRRRMFFYMKNFHYSKETSRELGGKIVGWVEDDEGGDEEGKPDHDEWGKIGYWIVALSEVREKYRNDEATLDDVVKVEQRIAEELSEKIDDEIEYDEDKIVIEDYLNEGMGQCVTHSQLYHIIAKSVGIETVAIDVPDHVTNLVYFSNGTCTIIEATGGSASEPFVFKDSYAESNGFWESKLEELPEDHYKRLRFLDDDDLAASVYNNRGLYYYDNEKYDLALADFKRALELDPIGANPYINRGNVYLAQEEYEIALKNYTRAIELDPKDPIPYGNRGLTYQSMDKVDLATKDYNKVIDMAPDDAVSYSDRGNFYYDIGKYELALKDYNKALSLDGDNIDYYNDRGDAYTELKEYAKALKDYNTSIKMDAEHSVAYENRGYVYEKLGKDDSAVKDYTKALSLDKENAWVLQNRGKIYEDQKKYLLAIKDYTAAIEIEPEDAWTYLNRGYCYYQIDQNAKAKADWKMAVKLDPDGEDGKLAKENLEGE